MHDGTWFFLFEAIGSPLKYDNKKNKETNQLKYDNKKIKKTQDD